jgi:hypothetical protein
MLAGALAATGMTVRWWRTRRYLTSTAWAYARLVNFGHRLACSYVTGQTPYEYAHALARVIPQANASIHGLVELYVAECFGQRRAPPDEVEEVWGRLRSLLWRSWLRQWWASSSVRILWGNLRRVFG